MRIHSISMDNWQPYYGSGNKSTKIEATGKSGKNCLIVYGQNTHGKTALWQAIQFALYGQVNKRKTGWEDGNYRPFIGESSGKEPLLNITAFNESKFNFGVTLIFDHEGIEYQLDRSYKPRTGVNIPRRNNQMDQNLSLRNLTEGGFIAEVQEFINNILPENLAQFFMFDGERLDQYRNLFEDTNDVKLKSYIEDILRFPILIKGNEAFSHIKSSEQKKNRKFKISASDNIELIRKLKKYQSDLDSVNEIALRYKTELEKEQSKLEQTNIWLKANDQGQKAIAQEERYSDDIERINGEISELSRRIKSETPDSWRVLLTPLIDNKLDVLTKQIENQKKIGEQIGGLNVQKESLENQLEGNPCPTCSHIKDKPTGSLKADIQEQILNLEERIKKLSEDRIDPDPNYLHSRERSLRIIRTDKSLNNLMTYDTDLLAQGKNLRTAERHHKAAIKLIGDESEQLAVKRELRNKEQYLENIGVIKAEIKANKDDIRFYENEITRIEKSLGGENGGKTIAHKKCEMKIKILESLSKIWNEVTISHRENMRSSVEAYSSFTFKKLTNIKSYKGLKISDNFQISILGSDGLSSAGSSGQSALVAYSVLDALTKSSDIEFPLIIDTPGRSIDDTNMQTLFDYLFDSDRQIFLFPEGKELNPDIGDKRYGHKCAATYELRLNSEETKTIPSIRIDNLR